MFGFLDKTGCAQNSICVCSLCQYQHCRWLCLVISFPICSYMKVPGMWVSEGWVLVGSQPRSVTRSESPSHSIIPWPSKGSQAKYGFSACHRCLLTLAGFPWSASHLGGFAAYAFRVNIQLFLGGLRNAMHSPHPVVCENSSRIHFSVVLAVGYALLAHTG